MEQLLSTAPSSHEEATARLIESAQWTGIEIDREEAESWIAATSAESFGNVMVDVGASVHSRHRVTESVPRFTRPARAMGADSVTDYVERLTDEVYEYTVKAPDHSKAARRMYFIFRLTGRHNEATYIRELFDEPVTAFYQVAALLQARDEAADSGRTFESEALVALVDQLIMSAIAALEGRADADVVRRLLRLRDTLGGPSSRSDRTGDVVGVRDDARRAVDVYFERVLSAVPSIRGYLESVAATRTASNGGPDH